MLEYRSVAATEREAAVKEREVLIKEKEFARAWKLQSPVVAAFVVGMFAIFANAVVGGYNGHLEALKSMEIRKLQATQAEQSRLLQALQAPPDKAAENLQFLLDIGLIADIELGSKIRTFLANRKSGEGPSLSLMKGTWSDYVVDNSSAKYSGAYQKPATVYVDGSCEKIDWKCIKK